MSPYRDDSGRIPVIAEVVRDLHGRMTGFHTAAWATHDDVTIASIARAFDRRLVRHRFWKRRSGGTTERESPRSFG